MSNIESFKDLLENGNKQTVKEMRVFLKRIRKQG